MADDLLQHSLCVLFTVCVCVHCAVLEEQPRRHLSVVACGLVGSRRVTAVIASRKRPVPFRTRKLSSIAPMVLHSGGCGRVGRRRTSPLGSGGVLEPLMGVRLLHSPFFMPENASSRGGGAVTPPAHRTPHRSRQALSARQVPPPSAPRTLPTA